MFLLAGSRESEPQSVRTSSYASFPPGLVRIAFMQKDLHEYGMVVVSLHPAGPGLTAGLILGLCDAWPDLAQRALPPLLPRTLLLPLPSYQLITPPIRPLPHSS